MSRRTTPRMGYTSRKNGHVNKQHRAGYVVVAAGVLAFGGIVSGVIPDAFQNIRQTIHPTLDEKDYARHMPRAKASKPTASAQNPADSGYSEPFSSLENGSPIPANSGIEKLMLDDHLLTPPASPVFGDSFGTTWRDAQGSFTTGVLSDSVFNASRLSGHRAFDRALPDSQRVTYTGDPKSRAVKDSIERVTRRTETDSLRQMSILDHAVASASERIASGEPSETERLLQISGQTTLNRLRSSSGSVKSRTPLSGSYAAYGADGMAGRAADSIPIISDGAYCMRARPLDAVILGEPLTGDEASRELARQASAESLLAVPGVRDNTIQPPHLVLSDKKKTEPLKIRVEENPLVSAPTVASAVNSAGAVYHYPPVPRLSINRGNSLPDMASAVHADAAHDDTLLTYGGIKNLHGVKKHQHVIDQLLAASPEDALPAISGSLDSLVAGVSSKKPRDGYADAMVSTPKSSPDSSSASALYLRTPSAKLPVVVTVGPDTPSVEAPTGARYVEKTFAKGDVPSRIWGKDWASKDIYYQIGSKILTGAELKNDVYAQRHIHTGARSWRDTGVGDAVAPWSAPVDRGLQCLADGMAPEQLTGPGHAKDPDILYLALGHDGMHQQGRSFRVMAGSEMTDQILSSLYAGSYVARKSSAGIDTVGIVLDNNPATLDSILAGVSGQNTFVVYSANTSRGLETYAHKERFLPKRSFWPDSTLVLRFAGKN